ncbi:unnamed protein product, partial [Mesorhabditis belari]|uniref:RNase H type-1 domain-containing protein n=1 Tax=Mesorhabditis belari TaxID=2138241 RepID=A0AAF3EK02_9BILA
MSLIEQPHEVSTHCHLWRKRLKELYHQIDKAPFNGNVDLVYIKAHVGILRNVQTDKMAGDASFYLRGLDLLPNKAVKRVIVKSTTSER